MERGERRRSAVVCHVLTMDRNTHQLLVHHDGIRLGADHTGLPVVQGVDARRELLLEKRRCRRSHRLRAVVGVLDG